VKFQFPARLEAGSASGDGIEITPKMIEAGVSAFLDYDPRFELREDAVEAIFRAMIAISPQGSIKFGSPQEGEAPLFKNISSNCPR
jgi:hypothetical protein